MTAELLDKKHTADSGNFHFEVPKKNTITSLGKRLAPHLLLLFLLLLQNTLHLGIDGVVGKWGR